MRTTIALVIPLVAIVMGVTIGMLALILSYKKRKDIYALYHQERMAAIEKGIELPPLPEALLADDQRPYNPRRHLLYGLVWLFIGMGAGIGVYEAVDPYWAFFALVPIGVGLAHLIYYAVEGKKEAERLELTRQQAASPR